MLAYEPLPIDIDYRILELMDLIFNPKLLGLIV